MGKKAPRLKVRAGDVMPPGQPGHVLNPVSWPGWPWRDGWVPQWDGRELGQRVSLVYSCVERVSSALSAMPLRVSKRGAPIEPPPWITNPEPDWYTHVGDAVGEIVWSLLMRGNAWITTTARYDTGYPQRWVVLDPDRVTWDVVEGRRGRWLLDGRPTEQMLHIKHMTRPGHRLGVSPLDAVRANLDAVASYEAVAGKLARNSGLPTQGVLTTDQDIPQQTAERYKERWQSRGDGEVAVLGSGLRFDTISLSPRDLALLELREFDGRQIATVFGVPPFMVNLSAAGDLTYSTVQGMVDFFWRQTLRPVANNIGRALSTLLPNREVVIEFDADDYVRGTVAEHIASMHTAVGGPFMEANEARMSIGLSPLPQFAGATQPQAVGRG